MEYLQFNESPVLTNIHLNRPSSLNSLTYEMVTSLRRSLSSFTKPLLFTGEGRSFCAGGDILAIATKRVKSSDFFGQEFNLFYELSRLEFPRLALLDGITMGGGAGLAMSCSEQVVTNKTLWAMPETAIGFIPDVGASYYLNRLVTKELGLFLSLTGYKLAGKDCCFAGITQLYIPEINPQIKSDIVSNGFERIQKYCRSPESGDSQILKVMPLISQCFNPSFDVESIIARLRSIDTAFTREIAAGLEDMCPLSLKIALELFRRGENLSYLEALELEYNLAVTVTERFPMNFENSIRIKLIEKKKQKIEWIPSSLAEISDGMIQMYFQTNNSSLFLHKL